MMLPGSSHWRAARPTIDMAKAASRESIVTSSVVKGRISISKCVKA